MHHKLYNILTLLCHFITLRPLSSGYQPGSWLFNSVNYWP